MDGTVRCPLCDAPASRPSWLGALRFDERVYPYVECLACRSLYAAPMPDVTALQRMYGPAYEAEAGVGGGIGDPKNPDAVLAILSGLPHGTFLDYGCGAGFLLSRAAAIGWNPIGVEFDAEVAASAATRTGLRVCDRSSAATLPPGVADVLHLGDVIEHLTDPAVELRQIIRLVKRGGYLVAQGPLEGNPNLFTLALKAWKTASGKGVSDMAPYHVMLATRPGQEALFARAGLVARQFLLDEVAWPAPDRLNRVSFGDPRQAMLFVLRRVSQAVSALRPTRWGNRYFYVGQVE
jgi:SAM-dependent methyltransferase